MGRNGWESRSTLSRAIIMASEIKIFLGERPLIVDGNVLLEPASEGRVVLWLPCERGGGFQNWERVATVAGAAVDSAEGLGSIPVMSVNVRQRLGGAFGKLFQKLTGGASDRVWTLPNGQSGEQNGKKRSDRRLVWSEDEGAPLDEGKIKARWPQSREWRSIGKNLFVIGGVEVERPSTEASAEGGAALPPHESPRALAEGALRVAREANDNRRVVSAMSDLGLAHLYAGDPQTAAGTLEATIAEARRLGDRTLEIDATGNFAQALLTLGHFDRAQEVIGPVLEHARLTGDRYSEKLALDRLGQALVGLGDHSTALAHLDKAWVLASELGDVRHEADLLWKAGIEHAELGHRDQAIAYAAAAVDRLQRIGNPTVGWYAHHLANYQSGQGFPKLNPAGAGGADSQFGGSIDVSTAISTAAQQSTAASSGPGLLRMALTATKSMAAFIGGGFKTATGDAYRARLAVCSTCEHHTGVRCRVCGCITAAKARLLHERCPTGRWPA